MALEAGARTYASAYISGEIGDSFGELKTPGQIFRASVAHGTLGGVMNVLGGGKFGHGFASAFMSKFILTHLDLKGDIDKKIWGTLASRTFVAAIVGGTISEATGGKFANGAVQSALQWAFNAESIFKKIGLLNKASNKYNLVSKELSELSPYSPEHRQRILELESELGFAKKIENTRDFVSEIVRASVVLKSPSKAEDLRLNLIEKVDKIGLRLIAVGVSKVSKEAFIELYNPTSFAKAKAIKALGPKIEFAHQIEQDIKTLSNTEMDAEKAWVQDIINGIKK